jgi:hypothetical protein
LLAVKSQWYVVLPAASTILLKNKLGVCFI